MSLFRTLYYSFIQRWAKIPVLDAELSMWTISVVLMFWLTKLLLVVVGLALLITMLVTVAWAFLNDPHEYSFLFAFIYIPITALLIQHIYLERKY